MKEKTFCDPIYPCSEETGQRVLRFYEQLAKERNMKEKKTKKMTKVEAYVYLNDTKVYVNGKGDKVLEVLSKVGFEPTFPRIDVDAFPFMGISDKQVTYYAHMKQYLGLPKKEISVDDILSIEIVDEKYELEFNYDKVVELAKPLMRYLNEVGFQDSIRVSQYGIVHEPMSTLIFDNGIGE